MSRTRTTRIAVGALLAAGLSLVSLGAVDAKDHGECNVGNGQAVWSLVPEHGVESGNAWGKTVSEWRMGTSGFGVSDGVHTAKVCD